MKISFWFWKDDLASNAKKQSRELQQEMMYLWMDWEVEGRGEINFNSCWQYGYLICQLAYIMIYVNVKKDDHCMGNNWRNTANKTKTVWGSEVTQKNPVKNNWSQLFQAPVFQLESEG